MIRTSYAAESPYPGLYGHLPSDGGVVVTPDHMTLIIFRWLHRPTEGFDDYLAWTITEFQVDCEAVSAAAHMAAMIAVGTGDATQASDPVLITGRHVYNFDTVYEPHRGGYVGVTFPESEAWDLAPVRIYSINLREYQPGEPPITTGLPLRQSSRTDGLVGTGRQTRPTLRQGRVSGPATIRGGA